MVDSFIKYLEFEKRLSRHTVLAYESDLAQFSLFLSEHLQHKDITTADYGMVRTWVIHLVDTHLEPVSVNRKIACLRSFYKFLLRQEAIQKDPMSRIRVLKTKKKLPAFVKESEMDALLDGPGFEDNLKDWRERLILELLYGTGIRLSELLSLQERNVDFNQRTIKVLGKRNKERVIPFSPHLVNVLKGYLEMKRKTVNAETPVLLVNDKGLPCSPAFVRNIVKSRLAPTSSGKKSPHVLRHSYATHMLNRGAEINAVKDLLGHSSLAATQVYTHNSMEKIKKVFEQAHPKA